MAVWTLPKYAAFVTLSSTAKFRVSIEIPCKWANSVARLKILHSAENWQTVLRNDNNCDAATIDNDDRQ